MKEGVTMANSGLLEVITKERFEQAMQVLQQAMALKKNLSPTKKTVILTTDGWQDGNTASDPYHYDLTVDELTETSTVELGISDTLSDVDYYNQMKELELAEICRVKKSGQTLTLVCYGQKPSINITIDLLIQ